MTPSAQNFIGRVPRAGIGTTLLMLTSCGKLGCTLSGEPACYDARSAISSSSTDRTPTETSVYTYQSSKPEFDKFKFIGQPLKFIFEKRTYNLKSNFSGGAQYQIGLSIDRQTFEPLISEITKDIRTNNLNDVELASGRYQQRELRIKVERAISGENDREINRAKMVRYKIKDTNARPLGRVCGFLFYDQAALNRMKSQVDREWVSAHLAPVTVGRVDLNSFDIAGVSDVNQLTRYVSCYGESRICELSFGYRGYSVSYWLPKSDICRHEFFTTKIVNVLDAHRVP